MVNDLVHLSGIDPNVILYGRSVLKPNYPKAFLKRFRIVSEKKLNRVPNVVAFVFSIFYIFIFSIHDSRFDRLSMTG